MSLILGFVCLGFMFLWMEERNKKVFLENQLKIEMEYSNSLRQILENKMEELNEI